MVSTALRNKREKGFTIIEVMIVLAIAGLIMLIVFLAVPALQRNSRNTSRKSDASRIAAAITEFVSNNGSALPDGGDVFNIINSLTLSQYSGFGAIGDLATACAAGTPSPTRIAECKQGAANVTLNALTKGQDAIVLASRGVCGTNGTIQTGGSTKQMALFYSLETTGVPTWSCIGI